MRSLTAVCADLRVRQVLLTAYYLAVLLAMAWLHGRGDFVAPVFVYQAF